MSTPLGEITTAAGHDVESSATDDGHYGYRFDDNMMAAAVAALPHDAQYAITTHWPRVLRASPNKTRSLNDAAVEIFRFVQRGELDHAVAVDHVALMAQNSSLGESAAREAISLARRGALPAELDPIANRHMPNQAASGFPLTYFDSLSNESVDNRLLLKGIMARGETSAWIAPPGGLKSALMAQASICVASGVYWHEQKNKGAAGVVYFALERADLVKRRLRAHRERLGFERLPIAVVQTTVNLMTPAAVPEVLATLRKAEQHFGCSVGLVIFDTFAKLIAAGGGDEDKARDQGATFANIQRVKDGADVHVAIVGHTGKDASRGARGSNAILGDADVMVSITGDMVRTANVTKANDGPEGPLFSFKSVVHEFGFDEDNEPITVNIVSGEAVASDGSSATGKRRIVMGANKVALDLLRKAVTEAGETPPASNHIPPFTRTISTETWRRYAYSGTISESDKPDSKSRAFRRAINGLQTAGLIGVWNDSVWIV
ncbi:MAG: AAA family ATPase [Alphaproteobacteria bacterium]|nr:AAA family ATPase [Alphaproteobacteria bacterium]